MSKKKPFVEINAGLVPPAAALRYFASTGSTNDEAIVWAEQGAPDGALVMADEQTSGKGRLGRRWFTPPGSALALSLILRPQKGETPALFARYTALGALAVCLALEVEYGLRAMIKWPNDVLLEGSKVSGILVEAQWQGDDPNSVVVGIGVNVLRASVPDKDMVIFPATCVENHTGRTVDRLALARSILQQLLIWRPRISQPVFLQTWEQRLAFRNQWVKIAANSGEPNREVKLLGLNADGTLLVQTRENKSLVTYHHGEIRIIEPL